MEQLSFFAELGIEDPKEVVLKKKEAEQQAREEEKKKKKEAQKAVAEARRGKRARSTPPKQEVFPDNLPIVVLYARAVREFDPGTSLEMVKTTVSREFQELSGNDTQWPWEIKDRSPEGELADPKKKEVKKAGDDESIDASDDELAKMDAESKTEETSDGREPPPEGWTRVVQVKPIVTFARKG